MGGLLTIDYCSGITACCWGAGEDKAVMEEDKVVVFGFLLVYPQGKTLIGLIFVTNAKDFKSN